MTQDQQKVNENQLKVSRRRHLAQIFRHEDLSADEKLVGAAIWRLGELAGLPGVPHEPGIFVVVGMMTCFGSVARAPLAIMIMVAEMTGSFSVVPGAIISVGIAALLLSRTNVTIYEAQRLNREAAQAERERQAAPD